ncbi:thiamine monophosphate synthase/TENI family protein [Neorickettsia helminthoeca str. Oregon]|uniref:Thiamine monophosphate synthase/TENI family protein n=1 Tax=Neorickettsia helminthoeca str. Oregon TaxID=1286528 RepID=X5HJL7_9RICK|nr:thiamine phosphate synthase [Neorickettsia helminthoeca]AHX11289.1 thiamine monophosphate synthase/TENI family protein [Neorickettsia helminthoeca str. Oregon]
MFRWLFIVDEVALRNIEYTLNRFPRESIVLLRSYEHPHRKNIAFWLSRQCRRLNLFFVVAGDLPIAIESHASGIHLRDADFHKMKKWKNLTHGRWFVSAASHSLRRNFEIQSANLDAALYSPVFTSKDSKTKTIGHLRFIKHCYLTRKINIFALGGTSKSNIRLLKRPHKKAGIAGIRLYNHSL